MEKLIYRPDQESYSESEAVTTLTAKLDGGFSRVRKDLEVGAHTVNVQWRLNLKQYKYMSAFYRKATDFGSKPFLIDLWMGYGEIAEYEARIIKNSWKLSSQRGEQFTIKATLEVIPQEQNDTVDCEILNLNAVPPVIVEYIVAPTSQVVLSAYRHPTTVSISQIAPPDITSATVVSSESPVLMGLIE